MSNEKREQNIAKMVGGDNQYLWDRIYKPTEDPSHANLPLIESESPSVADLIRGATLDSQQWGTLWAATKD